MNLELTLAGLWRTFIRARVYRLFPLAVILLAAALRFHLIEAQSFWNDEGNTLRLIERAIPDLITASNLDIHPPGYYLLLKLWHTIAGDTEFALRLFSAFAGALTVACVYALGRRLFAPGVGVLAALLVAVNSFSVYYGQEARMYALLQLVAAASMLAFVVWLSGSRRVGVLLALLTAAGLYTHYAFPAVMLTQGVLFVLWWIFHSRRARPMVEYSALNIAALLLFLPQLGPALRQISGWPVTGQPVQVGEALSTISRWLVYGNTFGSGNWIVFVWPILFALIGLLPDWLRRDDPPSWWRRLLPILWIAVTLGLFLGRGLFREANLKFLLPVEIAAALMIGRGLWLFWEIGTANLLVPIEAAPRVLAVLGAISILTFSRDALTNLYHGPQYARDDYRRMAAIIQNDGQPGDAILLNAPNQREVFTYYYRGDLPIYGLPEGLGGDDAATTAATNRLLDEHRRVFALYWGDAERDPNRAVERTLAARAFQVGSAWYGNVRFVRYSTEADAGAVFEVNAQFGELITLQQAALSSTKPRAGEVLGVRLTWEASAPVAVRYRVSVQLLDANGFLVAQHDAEPGSDLAPTTNWQPGQPITDAHGLLIPANVQTDSYNLIVILYRANTPSERLLVGERDHAEIARLLISSDN